MWPFSSIPFSADQIPDLSGKVIVITGANAGLGLESLLHLVKHSPARIYLCARSQSKYDSAMERVREAKPTATSFVKFLEIDLSSFASIKAAASQFLEQEQRLDILMNNAGINVDVEKFTEDGYQRAFGTNHMGHALLTKLLLPTLQKTAAAPGSDVRIVNLSSQGHHQAPKPTGFLPDKCKTEMAEYGPFAKYGQSKLCNLLHAKELARRYPELTAVAIDPGPAHTEMTGKFGKQHPWMMAMIQPLFNAFAVVSTTASLNQTWAAVAPLKGSEQKSADNVPEVESGKYYEPIAKEATPSAFARDEKLAAELWDWTSKEIEQTGY